MIPIVTTVFAIIIFGFTNAEIITVGNAYNIRGWTVHVAYAVTALSLLIGMFAALGKAKKRARERGGWRKHSFCACRFSGKLK